MRLQVWVAEDFFNQKKLQQTLENMKTMDSIKDTPAVAAEVVDIIKSSKPTRYHPQHIHFVGSIPLSSSIEVFTTLSKTFPGQLRRLPDGETGKRWNFVAWQHEAFAATPQVIRQLGLGSAMPDGSENPNAKIDVAPIGYDDMALESYTEFCKLRKAGVIEKGVKFQVSLPTPVNTIAVCVQQPYQADAEAVYEPKLMKALRKIQDKIPAEDLAIQWDLAIEVLMLETVSLAAPVWESIAQAWFPSVKEGIKERLERLTKAVDPGVQLGYHICYGDLHHRHFANPTDMSLLVEVANIIHDITDRNVNWVHMPVPKDRDDEAYFAPLKGLKLKGETELCLGLIHAFDEEGTRKKIEVARGIVEKFSVATECGCGREAKEEFEEVLRIMSAVTANSEAKNSSV